MPKLSIIIAAYNHEKFVRELLESLLAQTFQDFELIAIDDGSSDKTPDILAEYEPRIRLIRQKNQGVVAARMRGIKESSGEYACFVDSDDKICPDRFERQIKILDDHPDVGLVYGDAIIIDEEGRERGRFSELYPPFLENVARNLFCKYCFIPAITATFRRSVFDQTNGLWGPGPICDYLKWIEIALLSEVRLIDAPLGYWRRHVASVSFKADMEKSYLETLEALKQLYSRNEKLREITKSYARRRYARCYFMIGFFSVLEKDFKKARQYFHRAVDEYPVALENLAAFFLALYPIHLASRHLFNYIYRKFYKWR